ncbi:MAG: amphi-Trp domain-containing protein [Pseudomonadota bacterium]
MSKQEVVVKKTLEMDKAIQYLQDIVDSLKAGRICVEHQGQSVFLTPAQVVEVEFEATKKKNKERIELEITWHSSEKISTGEDLSISPKEPPVELPECPESDRAEEDPGDQDPCERH